MLCLNVFLLAVSQRGVVFEMEMGTIEKDLKIRVWFGEDVTSSQRSSQP